MEVAKTAPSRFEKLRPSHWRHAALVLSEVQRLARPADQALQALFRAHREMGSRDRAEVGELVYGVLRDARRLQELAGSDDAAAWCAALVLQDGDAALGALLAAGFADADALARRVRAFDESTLTPAQRCNVPDPEWSALQAQYGDEAQPLAAALNRPASVDLRVNLLRGDRAQAQALLDAEGIASTLTPLSPLGLRLTRRAALQASRAFREGWIEPQDEGSQLLALLLAAQPGETVLDWCAGAGGKTLALAAQMQNRGRLIACDTQGARLERMHERLARAGVGIVQQRVLGAPGHEVGVECDAVLVDAPCSATGTWRRNPELRLRPIDPDALAAQQLAILEAAAGHVKPGGRLVYATCSVLAQENEDVVARFLQAHAQFEPQDASEILRAQGIDWAGPVLRLLPHRHGTDGFFAAALRRAA